MENTITIKQVISAIEERIPKAQAEDFDNVGLLCGNWERIVSGILVCHDALESVVEEAIALKSNLIVAFHPIIFSGLNSITGKNYVEKVLLKAIENKIAIYAVHTAWDNDYYGVNYKICNELGLENQQILMPKNTNLLQLSVLVPKDFSEKLKEALFSSGAGKIGFYDECSFSSDGLGTFRPLEQAQPFLGTANVREKVEENQITVIFEDYKKQTVLEAMRKAHPYEEIAYQIYKLENENQYSGLGRFGELPNEMSEEDFLNLVKNKFNLKVIRHSYFSGKKIKKVGVLGGSGAGGIKTAFMKNCDAYLTGDIKHHDFFLSENKMLIADIGHYESEQFVVQQLYEILSEKFTTFVVSKTSKNTNPVNYFF